MHPLRYFFGRALQVLGLATITWVVFMFFTKVSMEPLLYWTISGGVEFYAGTWVLGKADQ